jgi:hypothetical protein
MKICHLASLGLHALTTDEIFSFLKVALTRQLNSWWSLLADSDRGFGADAAANFCLPFAVAGGLVARGVGFVRPSSTKRGASVVNCTFLWSTVDEK